MSVGSDMEAVKVGRLRARYVLALVLAVGIGLGFALPAFGAQDEPDLQPQIVGGDPVSPGRYPFVAALRDTTRGSTVYEQQFCGGTLIDADSVLTAAHCIRETGVRRGDLRVTVGITNLDKRQGQSRRVSEVKVHPRYDGNRTNKFDAAVLTLQSPVSSIDPARIPATTSNSLERPGRSATIAGWGSTVKQPPGGGRPQRFPSRMQAAQVPIVSDKTAERVYKTSYFPTVMLAAGREGKDTCQGDSGGPIFFQTQNGPVQVGITSFGTGCGARGFPNVYAEANAGPIRNFITEARRQGGPL